ncbi:MAG: family 16 glycosylhydrolase [Lentisphaeria bacterium]|nr:family 16 glycosylhydrolase [Lentisphaeria bacterium]
MKKHLKFLAFLLPAAVFAAGESPILFSVPFDGTAVPAVRESKTKTILNGVTEKDYFPGLKGKALRIGADEKGKNLRSVTWTANGNIRQDEGTLSFYFKMLDWQKFKRQNQHLFLADGNRLPLVNYSPGADIHSVVFYEGRGGRSVRLSKLLPVDNVWHHWAAVWNKTQLKFYLDGRLLATRPRTFTTPEKNWRILTAGALNWGEKHVKGYTLMDELTIYGKELSPARIKTLARDAVNTAFKPVVLPKRKRILPEPLVVAQTQLYPSGDRAHSYLGRWVDQPLLIDPALPGDIWRNGAKLGDGDYKYMAELLKNYDISGFSFFAGTKISLGNYPMFAKNAPQVKIVPIYTMWNALTGHVSPDNTLLKSVNLSLNSPQLYTFKGKKFFGSYDTESFLSAQQFEKNINALRKHVGDRFWFLPDMTRIAYHPATRRPGYAMTAEETRALKEKYRSWLRIGDGIYFNEILRRRTVDCVREFDGRVYRDFIIKNMLEILEEPEFKGKKMLGLTALVGHENPNHLGCNTSSNGTKTLRDSLAAIVEANPDYVTFAEWDEYNENTCFMPTLYNSFSTMRIVRYFMALWKGKKLSPLPGDDITLPNLVLSYRKIQPLGERLVFEVINIPDGSWKEDITCFVTVRSVDGKILKTFAPQKLAAEKLSEVRFIAAGEDFSDHRGLTVSLTVRSGKKSWTFDNGLTPIGLRTGVTTDYKFAKHPLRDQLKAEKALFSYSNGKFKVDFKAGEPLRTAALNLNGDIVYLYDKDNFISKFRDSKDYAVFAISNFAWISKGMKDLKGSGFSVPGIPEAEWLYRKTLTKGEKVSYTWINKHDDYYFLRIPRSKLAQAKLRVTVKGHFDGQISLADVARKQIYSVCGNGGHQLTVSVYKRFARYPRLIGKNSCQFEAELPLGEMGSDMVFFHAVGMSGKTWRSRPIVIEPASKPVPVKLFSAYKNEAVTKQIPSCRVPYIKYDFSPASGGCIRPVDGKRFFSGMLGSGYAMATQRNRSQGNLGDPLSHHAKLDALITRQGMKATSAPKQVKLADGSWALDFAGTKKYAAFPAEVVPGWSEFVLEAEIMPRRLTGARQRVICTHDGGPGDSGTLYGVFVDTDGTLRVDFAGLQDEHSTLKTKFKFKKDAWNKLKLHYAVDKMTVEFNGQKAEIPCCAPGRHPLSLVLGGYPGVFFDGMIRNLSIDHTSALR